MAESVTAPLPPPRSRREHRIEELEKVIAEAAVIIARSADAPLDVVLAAVQRKQAAEYILARLTEPPPPRELSAQERERVERSTAPPKPLSAEERRAFDEDAAQRRALEDLKERVLNRRVPPPRRES